jgi:hypothetical protein
VHRRRDAAGRGGNAVRADHQRHHRHGRPKASRGVHLAPELYGARHGAAVYEVIPFVVSASGNYTFSLTSPGGFASLYLFTTPFDPNTPFPSCIAADNTGNPVDFTEALTANVLYLAVPFDDTFSQAGGTYSLTISGPSPAFSSKMGLVASGAGPGGGPHVRVFDVSTGLSVRDFLAYAPSFTGGARVALGDVTGDGIPDIVTGAGPGGGPHVQVFDGVTGAAIRSFFAYSAGFTGGVFVATSDVNGDGRADIITGAGPGGGPHVRVFDGVTGAVIREFFAYPAGFTGGVFVGSQ